MIDKIDHINLTVVNLKESTDWYAKLFGFETKEEGTSPSGLPYAIVASGDFMLCMYEAPKLKSPLDWDENPNHRINHFGLRIKDESAWRALVKKHDLKIEYGTEIDYGKSTSWYVVDPSGHEIEVSYRERSLFN